MKTKKLRITTGSRPAIVDITQEVQDFLPRGVSGLLNISLPHATAGLALMELGSQSETDLIDRLEYLLPRDHRYHHSHGSPGHGADHLLPAFISPTITLPVFEGKVSLGTWQRIALVDTNIDNPHREIQLSLLEEKPQ